MKKFIFRLGCKPKFLERFFLSDLEKIFLAISKSDINIINYYLNAKKFDFNEYDSQGNNALHYSVKEGKIELVNYFIQNIKDINIEDQNFLGDTCLILAIFKGSLEMVQLLVEVGKANPNTAENKGYTPFMAACSTGNCQLTVQFDFFQWKQQNIYQKSHKLMQDKEILKVKQLFIELPIEINQIYQNFQEKKQHLVLVQKIVKVILHYTWQQNNQIFHV